MGRVAAASLLGLVGCTKLEPFHAPGDASVPGSDAANGPPVLSEGFEGATLGCTLEPSSTSGSSIMASSARSHGGGKALAVGFTSTMTGVGGGFCSALLSESDLYMRFWIYAPSANHSPDSSVLVYLWDKAEHSDTPNSLSLLLLTDRSLAPAYGSISGYFNKLPGYDPQPLQGDAWSCVRLHQVTDGQHLGVALSVTQPRAGDPDSPLAPPTTITPDATTMPKSALFHKARLGQDTSGPADVQLYYDDWVISRQPVGCF